MTKLQTAIVNKANRWLKKNSWYQGVSVDLISSGRLTDAAIKRRGVYKSARDVYIDTVHWDAC